MPTVLAFMAHPDDAEFLCAGLLTLLRQTGWDVHIATMTPGDLGSATLSSEEIARIRHGEAAASAALLEASYTCLWFRDLIVVYGEETKRPASAVLREVRPDLLVTLHPSDYMEDHTETARIAREADAVPAFVPTRQQDHDTDLSAKINAPHVIDVGSNIGGSDLVSQRAARRMSRRSQPRHSRAARSSAARANSRSFFGMSPGCTGVTWSLLQT